MGPSVLVEHGTTERLKTLSVGSAFRDEDLRFRAAPRPCRRPPAGRSLTERPDPA